MLEELRVALFAQELRTPMPVSVKRPDEGLGVVAAVGGCPTGACPCGDRHPESLRVPVPLRGQRQVSGCQSPRGDRHRVVRVPGSRWPPGRSGPTWWLCRRCGSRP
ncbi:DUF3418 domain-containing protein [Bordetella pertussis]|uniref:DUF3418 domain-containing protein n=1 Tax=Bordetella pertussis TaxID=520 RepID=UPI003AAB0C66